MSGYTWEKPCHVHPGSHSQTYWIKGTRLIQGTAGHWLDLDVSGPGSRR